MNILEFMKDIADNEALPGKEYSVRIEIDDGGINSYISVCIDTYDYDRKTPVTESIRLFRHSNSDDKLVENWEFRIGNIINIYADKRDAPMFFGSYGKIYEEAEQEAIPYFDRLREMVKKRTSDYKIEAAKGAEEEREKLLARLSELDGL